jgi:hypothetical protein
VNEQSFEISKSDASPTTVTTVATHWNERMNYWDDPIVINLVPGVLVIFYSKILQSLNTRALTLVWARPESIFKKKHVTETGSASIMNISFCPGMRRDRNKKLGLLILLVVLLESSRSLLFSITNQCSPSRNLPAEPQWQEHHKKSKRQALADTYFLLQRTGVGKRPAIFWKKESKRDSSPATRRRQLRTP